MQRGILVAGQLSALFPSTHLSTQQIHTTRPNVPLPPDPSDSDLLPEHASQASVLHTPSTGTLLLRVLHAGCIIEVFPLSGQVPPIRFLFPSPVCKSPAMFLDADNRIHILAVTEYGSLFRIIIPIRLGNELWGANNSHFDWSEYHIRNVPTPLRTVVHVQGLECIGIALAHGALLRLDMNEYEAWSETVFQPGSFLSSLSSFLPSLGSAEDGTQIISMATHTWPTDIGHIWTLSRDRTLRYWKARVGCVASKSISPIPSSREPSPTKSPEPWALLEAEPQTLLRAFSTSHEDERIFVMAYIPPVGPSISSGTFHIFVAHNDKLQEIGEIDCPQRSGHFHLQDFMVIEDTIYTLWDWQGQAWVERMTINLAELTREHFRPTFWVASTYTLEPELTPGYIDQLLLSPGSFTDKYLDTVLRPGVFSPGTLKAAIGQYTDIYASLPGERPPQLQESYATVEENIAAVVGCTVKLNRDPNSGALQYENYWGALRRDWEGFVARCREIERSARWPLVLGAQGAGEIIVVERERVGALVPDDNPIHIHRTICEQVNQVNTGNELIVLLWALHEKLGPIALLNLENQLKDALQQDVAFSFADIVVDLARHSSVNVAIDEGMARWMTGRLQGMEDLDAAIRSILDVVGALDVEVKMEEEEIELLLPSVQSDWSRALTASFINVTANARYEIALSLMALLFFVYDELGAWDPALLAEIFAVYRGIAIVRYIARQPARAPSSSPPSNPADDVVSQLQGMRMSQSGSLHFSPTHSLLQRLLAQSAGNSNLPGAAHRFLDQTGLLQSVSPALAIKEEVSFSENLRSLGYCTHAQETLSWFPRSPSVVFVQARLCLDMGQPEEAADLFEIVMTSFGPERATSLDDLAALAAVLPDVVDTAFAYYAIVASLFRIASFVRQQVTFTESAIALAPPDFDASDLWSSLIHGYTDLGLYDEAATALAACPYDFLKRESIAPLVYRLCEENAVEKLTSLNFANLTSEVQEALAFKARNTDPRIHPSYSQILYNWYVSRGDYRNAGATMYAQAQKLRIISVDRSRLLESMQEQLEAYAIAINCLSLLDEKDPSIIASISSSAFKEFRKASHTSNYIPQAKFTVAKSDGEIVKLSDIRYEQALLIAQMDVLADETSLPLADLSLPPSAIVLRFAQADRFQSAFVTARSLGVDMTDIFIRLTNQCLSLPQTSITPLHGRQFDWLLSDDVSSWSGSPAEKGWRYLRQSLRRYDSAEADYRCAKASIETVLAFSDGSNPPSWLLESVENHHPEFIVRVSLTYGRFEYAVQASLALLRKASDTRKVPSRNASSSWLPYALLEQVVVAASKADPPASNLPELQSQLASRIQKLQKTKGGLDH